MGIYKVNPYTEVPAEKRQLAYANMYRKQDGEYLILHRDKMYTVDEANDMCAKYMVEGKTEYVNEIQPLIINAKNYIRELYPDEI